MIDQLFGSKTRVKLLTLFYSNPNRSFYVREITRKIDEQINSVRRELANLLNAGLIIAENTNNRLYYEVDQKFEYYGPFSEIFGRGQTGAASKAAKDTKGTKKASVAHSDFDEEMKALGKIDMAFYTGQFTRDESSGIDFLIVGHVNENQVHRYVSDLEEREGKEIRYVILSPDEFAYRQKIKDRFLTTVLDAKKQVLIDRHGIISN